MNFHQQATLFAQHGIIIAVHAGALANLIFCRPGTRIVELACLNPGEPQANSQLASRRHQAGDKDDIFWQGPVGLYSAFTRSLGMEHYILSDTLNCTTVGRARRHDAATVVAAVNETVQFLTTRLGL